MPVLRLTPTQQTLTNLSGQNSVLDPWYVKMYRELMDASGMVNPTNIMPNVEMTTFLKGGVPDVAARQQATLRNLKRLRDVIGDGKMPLSRTDVADTMRVARRYPRVMAHMAVTPMDQMIEEGLNERMGGGTVQGANTPLRVPGRSFTMINQRQNPTALQTINTLTHEMTHAAQNIGLKEDYLPTYKSLEDIYGYDDNPMEVSARQVGAKHTILARARQLERAANPPPTPAPRPAPPAPTTWERFLAALGLDK